MDHAGHRHPPVFHLDLRGFQRHRQSSMNDNMTTHCPPPRSRPRSFLLNLIHDVSDFSLMGINPTRVRRDKTTRSKQPLEAMAPPLGVDCRWPRPFCAATKTQIFQGMPYGTSCFAGRPAPPSPRRRLKDVVLE